MKTAQIMAVCGVVVWMTRLAGAAAITPGNLLVYRVDGNGSAPGSDAAIVHIDEYTIAGTWVQTFTMPSGTSGTRLTGSGTATSEGKITVSPNGAYVAIVGYDAAENTPSVVSTTNRTVARISTANGTVNLTTTGRLGGNDNARAAVVDDTGTNIWAAFNGGAAGDIARSIRYLTLGQTTAGISLTNINSRGVRIFGGQLYEWGAAANNYGVFAVGTGLPTTSGQTMTGLPGISSLSADSWNCYGFFMADLSATVPGFDTLWMAREATGVSKYSLVGGTWTLNNTIDPGAVYHLDGWLGPGGVTLAIVDGVTAGSTRIMTLTDGAGYNANMSGTFTEIIGDPAFNAFRGVVFAVPEPGTATLLALAGVAIALRRRLRA